MILETLTVGMFQCNCIIVGDETTKDAIVIDPGDEVDRILGVLSKHQFKCRWIVHTHTHIDHAGGTAALQKATGGRVALHEKDVFLYDNLGMQASLFGMPAPDRCTIDEFLRDGQSVSWGNLEAQILHTPGHTPGSLCLHLPDNKKPHLFSGDTLFMGSIGRTDLWGGDFDQEMGSIKNKLLKFPDETIVLPGHGPATTIGQERRSNPFILNY